MTDVLRLPPPQHTPVNSLEAVLIGRRSTRAFSTRPLALAQLGHLLWAAGGITAVDGKRTAPSAGGLYPLSLHVAAGAVNGAPPGVYRYNPNGHRLLPSAAGDARTALAASAFGQMWMADAPAIIAIAAAFDRTTGKYGERGLRYVFIESGAAAQNLALQATALGLGTAFVGAFDDAEVSSILALSPDEQPLALLAAGRLPTMP